MFIGHFGVGLAAKSAAKQASLGTLFLASQFIDLLWPTFLLLGVESVKIVPGATKLIPLEFVHYPFSHSLLAVAAWSVLFGAIYFAVRRAVLPAVICGGLVASHWVLDALTHQPDLPLTLGGSSRIGLGLWNYPALAIGLELSLPAACFCISEPRSPQIWLAPSASGLSSPSSLLSMAVTSLDPRRRASTLLPGHPRHSGSSWLGGSGVIEN